MKMKHILPLLGLTITPFGAWADILQPDDVIISGQMLCVGTTCADGENNPTGGDLIKLKGLEPAIRLVDTSTQVGFATHNWQLTVNETGVGGDEGLYFEDLSASTTPFTIRGDAPTDSLYVAATGNIGMGTGSPQAPLHIAAINSPRIILDQTGSDAIQWAMIATGNSFVVQERTSNRIPFVVDEGAETAALVVDTTSNIGLGTLTPNAPLELFTEDSFNFFRITATGAAVNDSVDITFTGGPLGTGQLRYNIVDGDKQEMSLDANGNMVLDGTLTTAGPTCAGGCDRVFDAEYPLPSIEEHASQMFRLKHLPSIGATQPHVPVNISERQGNIINSLEHAHIYIAQQQQIIEEMLARLAALEQQ